jgi:BMFP domain-containing protein YqiC
LVTRAELERQQVLLAQAQQALRQLEQRLARLEG